MIELVEGDIFQAHASECEALVNPVNCEGIMGKGLAAAFKDRFRANFESYAEACKRQEVKVGRVYVYALWPDLPTYPFYIINFPTKKWWKDPSRLWWIQHGLLDMRAVCRGLRLRKVAVPALGCGLGGLEWPAVRQLMEKTLSDEPCEFLVYEPQNVRG